MSDVSVFVVRDDALLAFTRPAIDLSTGQIVELDPKAEPVQLELFERSDGEVICRLPQW